MYGIENIKKLFYLIILLMLFSSCKTNQNIVEKIVYRDTTIHVKLPYQDTVKIHKTLVNEVTRYKYKDSVVYIYQVKDLEPIYKKNGIIGTKIWLKNYRLNALSYLTDSTILTRIKKVYVNRTITDNSEIEKLEKKIEKKDQKIKRKNKLIGLFVVILLIIVAIFIIKNKIKIINKLKNLKL